jgi:hypothetical protein
LADTKRDKNYVKIISKIQGVYMLYSIKKFFRKKKKDLYQNELIEKLNKEHQKLFDIVTKMDNAIEKKDIKQIKKLISTFKKELELHLLYEDTNLYEHLYLKYYYYDDIREAIKNKHDEMKNIAQAVEDFIATHKDLDNFDKFVKDFEGIKKVLVKRISFEEETLYDIYDSSYTKDIILKKLS